MESERILYLDNKTTNQSLVYFDQSDINRLVYNGLIAIAILFCNSVQAYVFATMKTKSFSNVLFMSIAISDSMFGAIALPLFTIKLISATWPLGRYMCYFTIVYIDLNFSISNYWLFMLSMHRLLSMIQPYRDHETVTKSKIVILLTPLTIGLIYISSNLFVHVLIGDFILSKCSLKLNSASMLIDLILYGVPITLTIITNLVNIIMLHKKFNSVDARNRRKLAKLARPQSKGDLQEAANNDPEEEPHQKGLVNEDVPLKPVPMTASIRSVKGFSDRMSHKSKETKSIRMTKEKKAVLCIVMLVVNTFMTEFCSFIIYLLTFKFVWAYDLYVISIFLVYIFPLINPILVFIFHDMYRKELLKKVKKIHCRCQFSR